MQSGNRQELQQMAYGLQVLENQLQEMQMQMQVIDQGLQELRATQYTMENLEKQGADDDGTISSLVPVGPSAQIRSTIQKPDKFIVPIGARYYLEQDYQKSMDLLSAQEEKMNETRKLIENRMNQVAEQIERIRPAFERGVQQMQQGGSGGMQGPPSKINLDDI